MHDYEIFVDRRLRTTLRSFEDIIEILAYTEVIILIRKNAFALDVYADLAVHHGKSSAPFITAEDAFSLAYYSYPMKNARDH